MKYVDINTNKVIWLHKIRLAHPNVSIPDNADLTDLGYIKVEGTEMPTQEGFYAVEVDPVSYKQTWELKPISPEELKQTFTHVMQSMLDAKAQEKGYDSILSACSYAGYDNPFRAEGEAYGVWRANCWQVGYTLLDEVQAETRPMPTTDEALALMPVLVLP